MVSRSVTIFTCDLCRNTADVEHIDGRPGKTVLPQDWVALVGNSNTRKVIDLQICPVCFSAIQEAILESQDISDTQTTKEES